MANPEHVEILKQGKVRYFTAINRNIWGEGDPFPHFHHEQALIKPSRPVSGAWGVTKPAVWLGSLLRKLQKQCGA